MSADLDALDRGLVDVGQLAAQALARVEALEARLAQVEGVARSAYRLGWQAGLARGRGGDPTAALDGARQPRPRHLRPVPSAANPGGGESA